MSKCIKIEYEPENFETFSKTINSAIAKGFWIQLITQKYLKDDCSSKVLPEGPGFLIRGGGSSGKNHLCLHPCVNLDQSAIASGKWLIKQGINPTNSIFLNALPLNHVSGLMPWWRSRYWKAEHHLILPSLMRKPIELENNFQKLFKDKEKPMIISLVPTQLQRLLNHPSGIKWLKELSLIWIGGAALPNELARKARQKKINLSPCYGATETTAMITALSTNKFLSGRNDCGEPLHDVEIKTDQFGRINIRTPRLALGRTKGELIESITDKYGWWESGDIGRLNHYNDVLSLTIEGRLDNGINSGGEIIFPEILEQRLLKEIALAKIQIKYLFLLGIDADDWGQRIVALVRFQSDVPKAKQKEDLLSLKKMVKSWMPAERPHAWYDCPKLQPNPLGKWDKNQWTCWLSNKLKREENK